MTKIMVIGSTQYYSKFLEHKEAMEKLGHEVRLPALDDRPELNELGILRCNLELMKWADEVHVIWDQRSMGTMFDFGMAVALGKKIVITFLEPKTFANALRQYEKDNGFLKRRKPWRAK